MLEIVHQNEQKKTESKVPRLVKDLVEKIFLFGKQIVTKEYSKTGFVHSYEERDIPQSYFEKVLLKELGALSPDSSILDLGAGKGEVAKFLKEKGFLKVFSVDRSKAGLEMSKEKDPESLNLQSFAETLPFEDNTFDVIHTKDLLQHIRDQQSFFAEIFRVLKPNGKLILTTSASDGILPNYGFVLPDLLPIIMKKYGFVDINKRRWIPKLKESARDWVKLPLPRTVLTAVAAKKTA